MAHTIPCSAMVLTRNSAQTLEACLLSLKEIEDVVIVDGYSTDATREIAKKFPNVRIFDQDKKSADAEGRIIDYSAVRNQALTHTKYPWIVLIDSDEAASGELIAEVQEIVADASPGVYNAFRRFFIDDVPVMHCAGYPAYQIRLFHRSCMNGFEKVVHERPVLQPGTVARTLTSEIQTPLPAPEKLWPKYQRYIELDLKRHGKTPWGRWWKWVFLRNMKTIIGILGRSLFIRLRPRKGLTMPFAYEWQAVKYAFTIIVRTFPLRS